jgi:hypothetical protein
MKTIIICTATCLLMTFQLMAQKGENSSFPKRPMGKSFTSKNVVMRKIIPENAGPFYRCVPSPVGSAM